MMWANVTIQLVEVKWPELKKGDTIYYTIDANRRLSNAGYADGPFTIEDVEKKLLRNLSGFVMNASEWKITLYKIA